MDRCSELGATDILRIGTNSGDLRVIASQPVILYGNPTANLEATPKQYVDSKKSCNNAGLIPQLTGNTGNRSGYIISASSEFNASFQAYNAFNFSTSVSSGVMNGLLQLLVVIFGLRFSYQLLGLFGNFNLLVDLLQLVLLILIIGYLVDLMIILLLLLYILLLL